MRHPILYLGLAFTFLMPSLAFLSGDALGHPSSTIGSLPWQTTKQVVTIPDGLGWDSKNYPIAIKLGPPDKQGIPRGEVIGWHPTKSETYAKCNSQTSLTGAYYVSRDAGNDSYDGRSPTYTGGTTGPFRSIWKAVDTINRNGTVTCGKVFIAAGTYLKGGNFSAGNASNVPTKSILFVATGGTVASTTADSWMWTQASVPGTAADSTFDDHTGSVNVRRTRFAAPMAGPSAGEDGSSCYVITTTLANAPTRVVDLVTVDSETHLPAEVQPKTTIEDCRSTPNTYFYDSAAAKLYLHRQDDQPPSDANTRVLRNVSNLCLTGPTQVSIFLEPQTSKDRFEFWGASRNGSSAGCLELSFSSNATGTIVYARNCSFRFAGANGTADGGNGVQLNNYSGIAWFEDCDASANKSDGFNFHDASARGAFGLTLNCRALQNGRHGSRSNNGWTAHDSLVAIDVGGYYAHNRGCTSHIINRARALMAGTVSAYSEGDVALGGSFQPCNFRTSDSAKMWCWRTHSVVSSNQTLSYQASDSSSISLSSPVDVGDTRVGNVTDNTLKPSSWTFFELL